MRGAVPVSEKKRFNLSLSMGNPMQREAWRIISGFPERERTSAVCWAVCRAYGDQRQEDRLREILREELSAVQVVSPGENAKPENSAEESQGIFVNDEVDDFLSSLQNGQFGGMA